MKNKNLNKIGHALLKANAMLSAGLAHVYKDIITSNELTRKEENKLLRNIIEAQTDSMHDTALIMSAAEEFEGELKVGTKSVHELAEALGVADKIKICDKCREDMSVESLNKMREEASASEPKTEADMLSALESMMKRDGINAEVKIMSGKDLPEALANIMESIAKQRGSK